MLTTLIVIFVVGYLCIALEHPLKVDKTATALVLGMLMWVIYALGADSLVDMAGPFKEHLMKYAEETGQDVHTHHLALDYILNVDIVEHLGDICQTLLFLIGAMTIVELVDVHGGFKVITDHIQTRNKKKLLWIIALVTFFLSAVLDNLTTTIVMIMLLRKLIANQEERWVYAASVVIAANTGGAWSPIGDVTTIMLWVKGNVTALHLIAYVLFPSIVACVLPLAIVSTGLKGELPAVPQTYTADRTISSREQSTMFYLGVGGLIFVPVFKSITHMPPFVGILLVLGLLWVFTEMFYNKKMLDKAKEHRLPSVISRIDMPSILFFLGILMAVAVLQSTGILGELATLLDEKIGNIYVINVVLGVLSSIVDNVPLVAAAMGMYSVPTATELAANPDLLHYAVDGQFWGMLSYCAGVGGSILIIGSAAGVIAMGLEKINFGWYLKKFSWLALIGYLAGAAVQICEYMIFETL